MASIKKIQLTLFKKRPEWKGLTKLQKKFFEHFFQHKNVFLTGPAGTGKSYCVHLLFQFLDEQGVFYGKTASTGVAALNIGGVTLHSWSGMGLADDEGMDLLEKVDGNSKAKNRIKACKVLVIDEISMMNSNLMDKLDIVCQYIRDRGEPFGGIQVVFVGDFMQLPPVFKSFEKETFAFESQAWKDARVKTVHLTEIVRQHDEPLFAKFLNEVRLGYAKDFTILSECHGRKFADDGIRPVRLFCKNVDVDSYNNAELRKLTTPLRRYFATDEGGDSWKQFFDKNCPAPNTLDLKVGAQVILLKNLDVAQGLVNGSVGIVESMTTEVVMVKFINGIHAIEVQSWEIKQNELDINTGLMKKVLVAKRKQIPLRLAWAITIHKSQGSTLDRAEVDVSEAFANGQVYVALSRVRNLASLRLNNFQSSKITVNKKCVDFYSIKQEEEPEFFVDEDEDAEFHPTAAVDLKDDPFSPDA